MNKCELALLRLAHSWRPEFIELLTSVIADRQNLKLKYLPDSLTAKYLIDQANSDLESANILMDLMNDFEGIENANNKSS